MTNTANQNKKPIMLAVYNWILDGCTEEIYNAHANFPGAKLQIGTALMTNNYNGSVELAQGKYDDRIRKYANQLKALPHDIFMRIGYEADGPWNGYDPEQFKLAFRRIVEIFREEQADNVAFVWNISYPTLSVYDGMRYYPGDEYVDWWSYDFWVENPHSNAPADFINKAAEHGKPVLVGESSKQYVQFGGEFWDKYFSLINSYPSLKGFQYINWYWNTYGTSDWQWGDARFTTDQKSVERYNKEMANSRYIGLDASYFHTSGLAIQFGHAHEFLNNQSSLFNMPWNKQEDNYTLNNGYDYSVENAVYSPIILHGQHSIRPADNNDYLSITFTVPDGRDGMIYFNDLNHQPKDAYIGQRQILVGSTESGKFNYFASDIINGTVTLKLKNTGSESMMIDYLMLQRISVDAPAKPTGLTVTRNSKGASLVWDPVEGADHYNIYRNGRIIGVLVTPSYTDTDHVEDASYAVTSYDLKQGESLMSDLR